ncbi:sigma-70 family RNA polymerase sigma factor, partial [Christensenellaceae bacterium OttesenSCG-928-M15]|nr:sigma-70 family RNA polymerase sigma factor [Christensenellaceae bacterium OttesenSCG-928-M15]
HAQLVTHARRMLHCTEDAEDAVQEVMLRIVKTNPAFVNDAHCKNYLHRAVRNQSVTMAALGPLAVPFTEEWMQGVYLHVENEVRKKEIAQWLQKNLKNEKPEIAEAFMRYALYNEKIRCLALEIGVEPATLRQKFQRIKKRMQRTYLIIAEIISIIHIFLVT